MKRHGQQAMDAVLSEFAQLNDKNIFTPMSHNNLTMNQRREALNDTVKGGKADSMYKVSNNFGTK